MADSVKWFACNWIICLDGYLALLQARFDLNSGQNSPSIVKNASRCSGRTSKRSYYNMYRVHQTSLAPPALHWRKCVIWRSRLPKMAEQQLALQEQVTSVSARMDRAAEVVGDLRRRLGVVERRLDPGGVITDDQAAEVSAVVKALAEQLNAHDPSKNHYQSIFGELYRRFGVSSYKLIKLDHYQAVLRFLEDWRRSAIDGTA
ncbi:MAG TPA: ORF6C domain-containing protein [Ktedonobacterales bacterium]